MVSPRNPREPIVDVVGHQVGTDVECDEPRHDPGNVAGGVGIPAEGALGVVNRGS